MEEGLRWGEIRAEALGFPGARDLNLDGGHRMGATVRSPALHRGMLATATTVSSGGGGRRGSWVGPGPEGEGGMGLAPSVA